MHVDDITRIVSAKYIGTKRVVLVSKVHDLQVQGQGHKIGDHRYFVTLPVQAPRAPKGNFTLLGPCLIKPKSHQRFYL